MSILITEFMDEQAVAELRAQFKVVHKQDAFAMPELLVHELADAQALIVRNQTKVTEGLLNLAPRLKLVGRLGVGLDNIDLDACKARGIKVIPATGANAYSVAEYVVVTAVALLRRLPAAMQGMRAKGWCRAESSDGREAPGRKLGIVGLGDIGCRVARLAQGLGFECIGHDPFLKQAPAGVQGLSFEGLLKAADVITIHVPYMASTARLFSAEVLAAMKPGSILINTSRGGIVDELALLRSLQSGHLGGAAIDVFETEPLPEPSPLAGLENVIVSPHISGVTQDSNQRVSGLIAERIAHELHQLSKG
ncbi:MAG: hydroxyacid dehydrogenase [Burkholderiaceae bacterium]|jgi:(S)-sulfolactate dehydrogenase